MAIAGLVAGVSAFLRLRRAIARARADGNANEPTLMAMAPLPAASLEELEQSALQQAILVFQDLERSGQSPPAWLTALFPAGARFLTDVRSDAPRWAYLEAVDAAQEIWAEKRNESAYGFTVAESYFLHAVSGEGASRRRWVRLARTLADTVFDVVAANPQMLGLELRAQSVVAALAGHMSAVIGDDDAINASPDQEFGERAFRVFLEAALATAVERPDFLVEETHLQALATGILRPLHEEVKAHPERRWIALDRLREALRGPAAYGALKAVQEHQDAFLKGEFAEDRVMGAVTRSILGRLISIDPEAMDVRRAFTPQGAMIVFRAALRVAQERPELFIDGQGGPTERSRDFLRGVAGLLVNAPFPFRAEDGLAPQIAGVALNVAQAYVSKRIAENTGESDWSRAGMAASQRIIDGVFAGLRIGLSGRGAAHNPLAQVFSRSMAVEVLQIIAVHVAERPAMLGGRDGSADAQALSAGFATLIAQDTSGLLRAQDWRALLGKLLDLASENPGALIGVDPARSPSSYVAVQLTGRLLQHATAELARPIAEGRPRLMGARLEEMIAITLAAAANNVIGSLRDPVREEAHFRAFEDFLTRLSTLAGGTDLSLRMSAADFQHVYQWFVALVLDHGPDAVITDDDIRLVIRGAQSEVQALRPAPPSPAATGTARAPVAAALDDRPEPVSGGDVAADPAPDGPPSPSEPSS